MEIWPSSQKHWVSAKWWFMELLVVAIQWQRPTMSLTLPTVGINPNLWPNVSSALIYVFRRMAAKPVTKVLVIISDGVTNAGEFLYPSSVIFEVNTGRFPRIAVVWLCLGGRQSKPCMLNSCQSISDWRATMVVHLEYLIFTLFCGRQWNLHKRVSLTESFLSSASQVLPEPAKRRPATYSLMWISSNMLNKHAIELPCMYVDEMMTIFCQQTFPFGLSLAHNQNIQLFHCRSVSVRC